MAGPRNRRLIVLLAAACFAVIVAASWLIASCTDDDDGTTPAPLPGFCMGMSLSPGAGHGISAALGFLLGVACVRVYHRFADGGDDEEKTAAVEMAGYVAFRDDDAEAAGGAKN